MTSTSSGTKLGPMMLSDPSPVIANYTMRTTDEFVLADATAGALTVTLPDVTTDVRPVYVVKKIDNTANVTIDGFEDQTIDGVANLVLSTQWGSALLVHDGAAWYTA